MVLVSDVIDVESEGIVLDGACACGAFRWDWFPECWRDQFGQQIRHMPHACLDCGALL